MAETAVTSNLGWDNFFSTTTTGALTATTTTIPLATPPTPTEGFLVLDPGGANEIIFYNSVSGNNVIVPSTDDRGRGDSTAQAHSSGITVKMNTVGMMFEALQSGLALTDSAITTAKIADANVTSEKLNATIAFRGTSTQAITNSASPTDITTYTEVFDLGADFSHTTGKFTCPLTGVYHFSASGGFTDIAAADARMGIFIENRTTTTDLCGQYIRTGATNHDPIISTSVTTLCTAGDEIIAKMYQDAGTESLVSPSNFSGFFVGV